MRRPRRSERPGHSATTAHCQAAYPFIAEGGLGVPGTYIGRDAYGGAWLYDPWRLYGAGLLADQNMIVVGKIGFGKSALVKTYLARQRVFGRQAWVLDVKGEYGALAKAMGGTTIALRSGGEVRLNPIAKRGGRDAQLGLLRSVAKAALRRELSPEEDAGLRVALDFVNAGHDGEEPTLPEVVDALLHPREEMVSAVSAKSAEDFAEANRSCALALQRLCEGDLRGMFDGPTSKGLDLDAPLVSAADSSAVGILMTCASAWQHAILAERKAAAEAGGGPGIPMISVVEEGWRVAGHIGVAEWLQESFKLCRSLGVQTILVLHNFSDLGASGAEGSREARIAENLIADSGTKLIYAQSPDQMDDTRARCGLSATQAELVPTLRRGEGLWLVGQRAELVQHLLSRREQDFTYTDARLASHALAEAS